MIYGNQKQLMYDLIGEKLEIIQIEHTILGLTFWILIENNIFFAHIKVLMHYYSWITSSTQV